MKGLAREYALVGLIIVMSIVGYLYVYHNKEDVLTASLDLIGERLVQMVEDAGSRAFIQDRFAQFKQQVLNHEVTPDQVENVAANVLNMSNSGTSLTRAQAELMLQFAAAGPEAALLPAPDLAAEAPGGPAPDDAPAAPAPVVRVPPVAAAAPASRPVPAVAPEAFSALGERLEALLAFNREVEVALAGRSDARDDMAHNMRFRFENGLHLNVDSSLAVVLSRNEFRRASRELKRLEKQRMVVWRQDVATAVNADREQARRELHAVESLRRRPPPPPPGAVHAPAVDVALRNLEALKELEAKGYTLSLRSDSLHALFQHRFAIDLADAMATGVAVVDGAALARQVEAAIVMSGEHAEVHVGVLEDYLDDVEEAMEDVAGAREEALEEQIDALDDALDELEDELEEADDNERAALRAAIETVKRRREALRKQLDALR